MSERGNSGWWLAVVLAIGVILFASLAFGAPNVGGIGLSWDNSAAIAREAGRTERNRQDNITRRQESEDWHATAQQAAVVGGIVGVVVALGWSVQRSVTAWAARPHRPVAPPRIEVHVSYEQARQLAQPHLLAMPGSRLENIDGAYVDGAWVEGWCVVDDVREIVRPLQLEDNRRG